MLKEDIFSLLADIGQNHLAVGVESLPYAEQDAFLKQLVSFGPRLLSQQRRTLFQTDPKAAFSPLEAYDTYGNEADAQEGQKKNCGCILLAGGQGTRLGSPLPKGLIPVSLIKNKSLLQIFCEKAAAASKRAGRPVSLAIMTSIFNDAAIRSYLEEHRYFGLDPEQVDLFTQEILPFLDDSGNWLLESPGKIAAGPDGNGHSLKTFFQAGIWEKWKEKGIECVNIVNIDNPLADPFDCELAGYHARHKNDVTVKAIFRHDPQEKMGVIGIKNNKIAIREYTEFSQEESRYTLANTGLFCLSIDFIRLFASLSLPWHLARKKALALLGTAKGYCQENVLIWKFETFIFDILDFSERTSVLVYPREHTYAPLKNATGDKSLETVRAALLARDRFAFSRLTGTPPPEKLFELDQAFHYPTESLCQKWNGKQLPAQDYVEAEL